MMTEPETSNRFRIDILAPYTALRMTNIAFGTLLAVNVGQKYVLLFGCLLKHKYLTKQTIIAV